MLAKINVKSSYYGKIHYWVKKQMGKANKCENKNCLKRSAIFEWANISGEYKRDLSDWKQMCRSCNVSMGFGEFCKRGHEKSPENIYVKPNGERECHICKKAMRAKYKRKRLGDKACRCYCHEDNPTKEDISNLKEPSKYIFDAPSLCRDINSLIQNDKLFQAEDLVYRVLSSQREEIMREVKSMVYEGTDGIHPVIIWRIDKEKFDKYLAKLNII